MQVHKENVSGIPNALPNRSNPEMEIYGMEGIPDKDMEEHRKQRKEGVFSLLSSAAVSDYDFY